MFERNENGKLRFNRLDFEIMISDAFENTPPKDINDLKWMVKCMIESIQLCAWEYVQENDSIEDEWEDVFAPNDF